MDTWNKFHGCVRLGRNPLPYSFLAFCHVFVKWKTIFRFGGAFRTRATFMERCFFLKFHTGRPPLLLCEVTQQSLKRSSQCSIEALYTFLEKQEGVVLKESCGWSHKQQPSPPKTSPKSGPFTSYSTPSQVARYSPHLDDLFSVTDIFPSNLNKIHRVNRVYITWDGSRLGYKWRKHIK